MIVFDGVSLDSIAPVKIDDIRVYPITLAPVTRQRAIQAGQDFVRMTKGTRNIIITFALLEQNAIERQNAIMAVSQWAKTDKEYKLELPNYPDLYLIAVCTGKPEPSMRQWWESKLRLTFTCIDDPYWISKYEKSASCGASFFCMGDAPPLMRIERTLSSAASNQAFSFGGKTMTFSTLPAGVVVIDLNRQTAQVTSGNATTSIMQYFTPTGAFIEPQPGTMNITGTGTIKYRERWA